MSVCSLRVRPSLARACGAAALRAQAQRPLGTSLAGMPPAAAWPAPICLFPSRLHLGVSCLLEPKLHDS